MRLSICLLVLLLLCVELSHQKNPHDADIDDNDFAEFEDIEDEEEPSVLEEDRGASEQENAGEKKSSPQAAVDDKDEDEDDEATVETEDDEFEHFTDEEEFEGFDREKTAGKGKSQDLPDLKIAKVPLHLRTNWDSFYLEMLMLSGLGVYFLNFIAGKSKNNKFAQAWLNAHKDILLQNFSVVGDDGVSKETTTEGQIGTLMKESENVYALWCSGRIYVEGMLVELKFLKRQDLISTMAHLFKPLSDQVMVTVHLDTGVMDKYVFAVAQKKTAAKIHKEINDLAQFTEKKSSEKFNIPSCFQILSEIGEATGHVLDAKMCQVLTKYSESVEYIHISDQYSGLKAQDESQQQKMPETKPVLIFCFNVPGKGKSTVADIEKMRELLQLVMYCIDKASRIRLGRESLAKAEKNRQKAEEFFMKSAHAQRQEAAQQRREEKRRQEKERIMTEEDPDKTRKWEERESRRDMKRKQPKMKMMKVKAM
ncbi:hypothetical protein ACJMK2_024252 [Sinanodonta woodiana]|uniref:PAT complex subunit CCDC47 n=1 Tax=Sinanodonta woodiana TaxID=1069815 RepID=A0ABD3T6S6_SINWO